MPLKPIDLKFLGFFLLIILEIISLINGVDILSGALGTLLIMMGRDLYRSSTNSGGVK